MRGGRGCSRGAKVLLLHTWPINVHEPSDLRTMAFALTLWTDHSSNERQLSGFEIVTHADRTSLPEAKGRRSSARSHPALHLHMSPFNLADLSCTNILPLLLFARHQSPVVPLLGLAYRGGEYVDAHVHPDVACPPDDEAHAVSLLIHWRWPWGWRCGRCHHSVHTRSAARPRQLRCAACGDRRSVTAGTALQKKHDLPRWFAAAIAMGAARQASARRFGMAWKCNYKTAWSTMQVLRQVSPALRDPQDQKGTWTACHDSHACRPDQPRGDQRRDPRRNRHPRFGGFVAMGPHAVYFVEHHQSRSFSRAVQQLAFPTGAIPSDAKVLSRHARAVLFEVHRTVSLRWAKRYLDALAQRATWIRQGDSPAARLLVDAVQGPPRPWATVPP